MKFTILGHRGFIGTQIVKELIKREVDFFLPEREENLRGKDLGKIIYCIGLTADAKRKPFDTIDAHINKLSEIIRFSDFQDITYASSTRVYVHGTKEVSEASLISVDVSDPFELFNLTKLTAESLLVNTVKDFKIVRYSNVYGADIKSENFLTSVIMEALNNGHVVLHTTADSAKDYISVQDAARITVDISLNGKNRVYNVASGRNTQNRDIAEKISTALNCKIIYSESAKQIIFPLINNSLIKREFNFRNSTSLIDDIDILIETFRKELPTL